MSKKSKEEQEAISEEYLKRVKLNPLADYKLQIKSNTRNIQKTIGETSLGDHIGLPLIGISPEHQISFTSNLGEFNHSKVITSAANRNLILALDANTQKLFLWILYALKYRGDVIVLHLEKMKALGFQMSGATFRKSIKELESNRIIKRVGLKRSDDYWNFFINPQIIFKGDAKKFYDDVIKYHPEYL